MKNTPNFQIGDEVVLTESAKRKYIDDGMNPYTKIGTVIDNRRPSKLEFYYRVMWSNGHTNNYKLTDLELLAIGENE